MLTDFLSTLPPMRAAKARAALEMQVRYNGGEFLTRHALVERKVANGAKVVLWRGEPIFQSLDGAFLDVRNITATGMDYARFLIDRA